MPDKKFTLKDSDRMIRDVIDSFFQEQNVTHDIEELMKAQGERQEVIPEGIEQQEI